MRNLNRIVLTGGLTRDPELRRTSSGASVAVLRVGYTTQRKHKGEWQDRSNYIDVEVWGARADSAARHLRKGRQVAVDGRLEWREFQTRAGERRQTHTIVADTIEYLRDRQRPNHDKGQEAPAAFAGSDPEGDDIPF